MIGQFLTAQGSLLYLRQPFVGFRIPPPAGSLSGIHVSETRNGETTGGFEKLPLLCRSGEGWKRIRWGREELFPSSFIPGWIDCA